MIGSMHRLEKGLLALPRFGCGYPVSRLTGKTAGGTAGLM